MRYTMNISRTAREDVMFQIVTKKVITPNFSINLRKMRKLIKFFHPHKIQFDLSEEESLGLQ